MFICKLIFEFNAFQKYILQQVRGRDVVLEANTGGCA